MQKLCNRKLVWRLNFPRRETTSPRDKDSEPSVLLISKLSIYAFSTYVTYSNKKYNHKSELRSHALGIHAFLC